MTKITFFDRSGAEHVVEADDGQSAMEVAVNNDVAGIDADCGGACACATCHAYIDEAWADRLPNIGEGEADMLDMVDDRRPTSRLLCQITVDGSLDGLIVRVPHGD